MKKVMVISLALILIIVSCVTALAAPDSFIESPGRTEGPVIEDFESDNPDFSGNLIIVPFKDRGELSTEDMEDMEDAYNSIINAGDLSEICADLNGVADSMGIPVTDLAVKDLFNIAIENGGVSVDGGKFTIKLDASDIKGFAGLMQYIGGQWVLVEGAQIVDGKLVFTTEELTSFAIVVDANKGAATSPQTGDPMYTVALSAAAIMTVAMCAGVLVVLKKKSHG